MLTKNEMPPTILSIWGQNILSLGWTTIPNLLLRSQSKLGLSNSELVLVIHLISFIHQPFSRVYPSIELLAKRMDQDRRTIQRTVKRLEDKGFIRKKIRSNGKKDAGMTNVYDLDPLMLKLINIQIPSIDPTSLPHICPHCKKTIAHTPSELNALFGIRSTSAGMFSGSWCRDCRSAKKQTAEENKKNETDDKEEK